MSQSSHAALPCDPHNFESCMLDSSLPQLLDQAVKDFSANIAYELNGKSLAFSTLGLQARRFAQGLLDNGVRPGDRVAIVLPTSFEAIIAFHAALRIGAIAVFHPESATMSQLARYFQDYEPECAITTEAKLGALAGIVGPAAPKTVVCVSNLDDSKDSGSITDTILGIALAAPRSISRTVNAAKTLPSSMTTHSLKWRDLLASVPLPETHSYPAPSDIASVVYPPSNPRNIRGLVYTHSNLVALVTQSRKYCEHQAPTASDSSETQIQDITFSLAPMHSISALYDTLTAQLVCGNKTILFPSEQSSYLLKALKKYSPANLIAPASKVWELVQLLSSSKLQPIELKTISLPTQHEAGEECQMQIQAQDFPAWQSQLGDPMVITKASAETGLCTAARLSELNILGFRGKPLASTQIRVVAPHSRAEVLPTGEVGRLMVRGMHVFHGYWNQEDSTSEVLSADGWLLTTELASITDAGCVIMADSPLK